MIRENIMKDYYKILSVEKTATPEELKKAFRKLAKKFHPDVNPDNPKIEEVFKEINEAYGVLSDETKKAEYDRRMFGYSEDTTENSTEGKTFSKASYKKKENMSARDFTNTSTAFEDYFGFNPKGTSHNLNKGNEKVKPMKTNEAFEAIFGKRKF